jgi:hypothetical protein
MFCVASEAQASCYYHLWSPSASRPVYRVTDDFETLPQVGAVHAVTLNSVARRFVD